MGGSPKKRRAAVHIVKVLRSAGHVAYLAGGCVRDQLLGRDPKDYDVATSAQPDAVTELFPRSHGVGEAFGVIVVRVDRYPVEVATFRLEWGYEDGRRPSSVRFTDAEHDAQRRDFTINGLFEDPLGPGDAAVGELSTRPLEERIIDYVGGMQDLREGVLRAIGVPRDRFEEDYLRVLRAVRFASRLGFRIDPATGDAMRACAPGLARITRERIGLESRLIFEPHHGEARFRAAQLLQQYGLDGPMLNGHHADAKLPTLETLDAAATYATVLGAWALDRSRVPEPGSGALLSLGLIGLAFRHSRASRPAAGGLHG